MANTNVIIIRFHPIEREFRGFNSVTPFGVIEAVLVGFFVATAVAAMLRSLPLIQSRSLTVESRVFPASYDGAEQFDAGLFTVRRGTAPGCAEGYLPTELQMKEGES